LPQVLDSDNFCLRLLEEMGGFPFSAPFAQTIDSHDAPGIPDCPKGKAGLEKVLDNRHISQTDPSGFILPGHVVQPFLG